MRMHVTHFYDADVETVFALVTDVDFLHRKYADQGATDVDIAREDTADGRVHMVTRRRVTVDLPGFAKRVMQPTNTVVHTEDWAVADTTGRRVCSYTVEVHGVPSRIEGTVTLAADGGRTRQDTDADVKVSVPLVGGRLEKFAADNGKRLLDDEAAFTSRELAAAP